MAMKTIDCLECGETVPYGRLSCPACGTLLASVTGGRSQAARAPEVQPLPTPAAEELASSSVAVATAEAEPAARPRRAAATRRVSAAKRRILEPVPADEPPTPWPPLQAPQPVLAGRPYQRHVSLEQDRTTWDPALASAYRPPSLTLTSATSMGPASAAAMPIAMAQPTSVAESMSPDVASARSMVIDAVRLIEIAGWFVVVGATMSMLGFLLPWSATVIGASGIGGYFDSWGMASPTHGFIALGLLGVLALGILPTPVAAWLKTGVLGNALGSLIIGLVWPYLVGRLGADVGVTVTALGGLALVIGGVAASWATRHAEPNPGV